MIQNISLQAKYNQEIIASEIGGIMKLVEQHLENLLDELCEHENMEDSLRKLVHNMDDLFEFQSLGIFLKDPLSNHFKFKTGRHLSQHFMQTAEFSYVDELIQALSHGGMIRCCENKRFKFEFDYIDLVIIPLIYRSDFQGFMFIDTNECLITEEEISVYRIHAQLCSLLTRIFSQEHTLVLSSLEIDPVTHLFEPQAFVKHGSRLFEQMHRYHHELHYVAMTIFEFSDLVQKFGKEKGKELRHKLGITLLSQLRKSDIMGSTGPDSGAILFPETTTEHVLLVVNRLNELISSFPELKQHKVCWGIAQMKNSMTSLADLQFKAVSALEHSIQSSQQNIFVDTTGN